jgi:BirA family transcriptional regulator, biotin operon repressor / biotin---[acetyl-CoA-carboxylase] ligase
VNLKKNPPPRVLHFESLDSTNEEALRQLAAGAQDPLWIVAEEQTKGRGRGGRHWQSPKGNLYASLLLRLNVSAAIATQLSFVAALAAYDAISPELSEAQTPGLRLKWPNDLMLDGAKIAGILIESLAAPDGRGLAAIVGIGVNVSVVPAIPERPASAIGCDPAACARVSGALGNAFAAWLDRWDEGRGFPAIRAAWLSLAHAPGEPISVNLNGTPIRGRFCGVGEGGGLELETAPGVVITVNAGDIYPGLQD